MLRLDNHRLLNRSSAEAAKRQRVNPSVVTLMEQVESAVYTGVIGLRVSRQLAMRLELEYVTGNISHVVMAHDPSETRDNPE